MIRDGVSNDEVKARIAKQWTDAKKAQYSDFLINNDEEEPLLAQVEACVNQLSSS
jgi:dephospho-CoA kinase